jgi:hypothetical protein
MSTTARIFVGSTLAAVALGAGAAPASALISLAAGTGAGFTTNFTPGATASATGTLTATDTSPSWTLQVQDNGAGAGHMVASASGCAGSDPQLANRLKVTVTSPLGGVVSAGSQSIGATPVTVASATSQLLASNVLTTSYLQAIPSNELMRLGCVYTLTATYTLQ